MENEEWLVKLDSGDVRMMTLDELDAAFQAGTIHEDTLVRRDGTDKWIKLAEEIGGSEPQVPPSQVAPTHAAVVQPTMSTHPVVTDVALPDDDIDVAVRSSRKRTRVIGVLVAVAVLGLFASFAVMTAVNASRTRARAALAAAIVVTPPAQVAAEPEPEPTSTSKDVKQNIIRKRRANAQQTGNQPPPEDKPAATVFKQGGDAYDPLNAKL